MTFLEGSIERIKYQLIVVGKVLHDRFLVTSENNGTELLF